jgi:enoyl-CoA hydratase/carnithine racemase
MGHANAFSLLVMGRPLNAGEAKALGIVNTVVSAAEVEAEAMKAAREISDLPPEAVLASRRLMRGTGEVLARGRRKNYMRPARCGFVLPRAFTNSTRFASLR